MKKLPYRLKCKRCDYEWWPRRLEWPRICPACKSKNWNEEKKKKVS